jgi:hypothetical protein
MVRRTRLSFGTRLGDMRRPGRTHPSPELIPPGEAKPPRSRRSCPPRARASSLTVPTDNGRSRDALSCTIGEASRVDERPGRAFQARDPGPRWVRTAPGTAGPQWARAVTVRRVRIAGHGPSTATTTDGEEHRTCALHVSRQVGQVVGGRRPWPRTVCGGPAGCWCRGRQNARGGPGL